jgi:hypothetical protein
LERLLGCFGEVIVGLIWRVILPLFLKLIWRVILPNLEAYLELFWSIFGAVLGHISWTDLELISWVDLELVFKVCKLCTYSP